MDCYTAFTGDSSRAEKIRSGLRAALPKTVDVTLLHSESGNIVVITGHLSMTDKAIAAMIVKAIQAVI